VTGENEVGSNERVFSKVPMRATLMAIKGGRTIPIVRDVTVVGRQEGLCDVYIDKSSISKLHCIIVRTDGLLFIRDLGSTNGTKVNGQRVVRGALLPGDELAFASEKYKVEMGPGDPGGGDEVHTARTEMLELPPRVEEHFAAEPVEDDEVSDPDLPPSSDSDVQLLPEDEQ
jgi:pSer/pThr/pTyr-binding forkhead associated (FHA) protein